MHRSFLVVALICCCSLASGNPAASLRPLTPRTAPAFDLEDIEGAFATTAEYRGKALVVNFWATWCSPCRMEMPSLQRAAEALAGDDIVVLAITVAEDRQTVAPIAAQLGLELPILLDLNGATAANWKVRGLPTTYIVDRSGEIVLEAVGPREWDDPDLLNLIRARAGE